MNLDIIPDDLSSDNQPEPFHGRYHTILRKRPNQLLAPQPNPKKQYKKKKIINKKLVNLYHTSILKMPISITHVFNFQNILAINEYSLRNPECEQSFLSSKFYLKKVKSVQFCQGCLLFDLQDINIATPISYIYERLKSYGDSKFNAIAEALIEVQSTQQVINIKKDLNEQQKKKQLESFLLQMKNRKFFSQFEPNLLIISRQLVQMLGYDSQQFAVEALKHRSILYEFFSAEHYAHVISKHLENMGLLREYLSGNMALDEFLLKSFTSYTDVVYNKSCKKINCQFLAGTSKHLTPFIQIRETQTGENIESSQRQILRKQRIEQLKRTHLTQQMELLNRLIKIPRHLDPKNVRKICSYRQMLQFPNADANIDHLQ